MSIKYWQYTTPGSRRHRSTFPRTVFDMVRFPFGHHLKSVWSGGCAVESVDSKLRCPLFPQRLLLRLPSLLYHTSNSTPKGDTF